MSTYRFLQDHYVNGVTYLAGTTAATFDAGGTLPTGWLPSGAVDPLDAPAVNAFYAVGPQVCGSIKTQWSGLSVAAPVTRWTPRRPEPAIRPDRPWRRSAVQADVVRRRSALTPYPIHPINLSVWGPSYTIRRPLEPQVGDGLGEELLAEASGVALRREDELVPGELVPVLFDHSAQRAVSQPKDFELHLRQGPRPR